MATVVHVVNSIVDGGLERGLQTLLDEGFYKDFENVRVVELFEGSGAIRDRIAASFGADNITPLLRDPGKKRLSRKELPKLIREAKSLFKDLRPQIVVLSDAVPQIVGRQAAVPFPEIKVIGFEHDQTDKRRSLEIVLKLSSWRVDAVFGDSPQTLVRRRHSYSSLKPDHHVPLRVLTPVQPRPCASPEVFKILTAGRLATQKNHPSLVLAIQQLLHEGHNVELTIAGEGPDRKIFERFIHDADLSAPHLKLASRVHLAGFISNEAQLAALRVKSDIFVMPSYHEGFCIAAAEALAAGMPLAATDFAGMKDYGTKDNFRLIEGTSPAEIADALRFMVVNFEEIGSKMSRAAITTARDKFIRPVVLDQWKLAQAEMMKPRIPTQAPLFARLLSPVI